MIDSTKKQQRVNAEPDTKLLNMLKSGNQSALQILLSNPSIEGLAAIEETIALYSGNSNPMFYRLGGQRVYTEKDSTIAYQGIIYLADDDMLLNDPAYTQSLIASLGVTGGLSNQIMQQLAAYPQKLYDYQLLGVHMQLSYLLREKINNTSVANKEIDKSENLSNKQDSIETSQEQKNLNETISRVGNQLEEHMITLIKMMGKNAETASKKDIILLMNSLTEHKNNINLSPEIRELAKNTRLYVIGIIMRRFPQLTYLADEGKKHSTPKTQYNSASKQNVKKKALILAFVAGIISSAFNIINIIIFLISEINSDYPISLGTFIFPLLISLLPLGIAFIAKQNFKTAGILFLIFGAFTLLSAYAALASETLIGIFTVLIDILFIVAGVLCLKAAKA